MCVFGWLKTLSIVTLIYVYHIHHVSITYNQNMHASITLFEKTLTLICGSLSYWQIAQTVYLYAYYYPDITLWCFRSRGSLPNLNHTTTWSELKEMKSYIHTWTRLICMLSSLKSKQSTFLICLFSSLKSKQSTLLICLFSSLKSKQWTLSMPHF